MHRADFFYRYISMKKPVAEDDETVGEEVSKFSTQTMATNTGDHIDVDVAGGKLMVQKLVKDLGYQPPRLLISMSGVRQHRH